MLRKSVIACLAAAACVATTALMPTVPSGWTRRPNVRGPGIGRPTPHRRARADSRLTRKSVAQYMDGRILGVTRVESIESEQRATVAGNDVSGPVRRATLSIAADFLAGALDESDIRWRSSWLSRSQTMNGSNCCGKNPTSQRSISGLHPAPISRRWRKASCSCSSSARLTISSWEAAYSLTQTLSPVRLLDGGFWGGKKTAREHCMRCARALPSIVRQIQSIGVTFKLVARSWPSHFSFPKTIGSRCQRAGRPTL